MRATLQNWSSKPRRGVAVVTFPRQHVEKFQEECSFVCDDGRVFRAVKCQSRGFLKTVFRIACVMNGYERIQGNLVDKSVKSEAFRWHRWTEDDPKALVPEVALAVPGDDPTWASIIGGFHMVESSPIHQRYWLKTFIPELGGVFEYWADIHHDDPVINFWATLVWSDRFDSRNSVELAAMIRSGEFMAFDFARRNGIGNAVFADGKWSSVLTPGIPFKDGSGLPISGRMLTFVGPKMSDQIRAHTDLSDMSNRDALDLSSLYAGAEGPIVGVCHEWDDSWLACLNVPRYDRQIDLVREADQEIQKFAELMSVSAGWYAERPLGIGMRTGATGGQEDFGATKGTYAVSAFRPEHIWAYQYSVYADVFRGFMHYESGAPLQLANHPNWTTWDSVTHFHESVSPDRLGKSIPPFTPLPANGYTGYDDEHRSQNNLAAYGLLTDDPLVEHIVSHHTTTDLASYRMKYPNYGAGAARAQGRTAGAWANFAMITDGDLLEKLMKLIRGRWAAARSLVSFSDRLQVPVLANHGPDGRKPIFDDNGNLLPTWSIWEHSLTAVGFYNGSKVPDPSSNVRPILLTLLRCIVRWGCFVENDSWYFVDDMWYRNGEPIPGELNRANKYLTWSEGGVGTWTLAALMIATEVLTDSEDEALREKARLCVRSYTGGLEARSRVDAEWWAVVKSVTL